MYAKRQRQISVLITIIGAACFIVISLTTIIWATGLKFDSATGSFERTAVIAVNGSLNDVTVSLDGKVVGNATPITLDGLTGGRYNLTITKVGFYPYEKAFQLSPGEAGVVKKAVLVAQQPQITAVPDATYQPSEPFDVGLSFQKGELLDFSNLVSRFSTPIIQAHRFDISYLYQQGSDLHLYFAVNSQDITIYHSQSSDRIKLNLASSSWAVTVFDGPVPKQLSLIQASVATVQP